MIALSDLRAASTSALSRSAEGSGAVEGSDLVDAHSLPQLSSYDMIYDDRVDNGRHPCAGADARSPGTPREEVSFFARTSTDGPDVLIRQTLPGVRVYDLLDTATY